MIEQPRALPKILVIDDDPSWLEQIPLILEDECLVEGYATIDQGLHAIAMDYYDVLLLDLNFDGESRTGLDVFKKIQALDRGVDVIVVSAETIPSRLIEVFNAGVSHFIPKPATPNAIRVAVKKTLEQREIRSRAVNREIQGSEGPTLVGRSAATQRLRSDICRVVSAKVNNVLILGETGTGKEVVARMIAGRADRSPRFVAVHCGAINDGLAESELFGHVKGAFTGADVPRVGAFEAAGGGYVFLDEIGEMPMAQQAKLLRVLQERKVQRVGSNEERPCNFRLIAATNINLEQAVAEKRFREDLYYRIAGEKIVITPLRERIEDIPELVYDTLAKKPATRKIKLTSGAMALLQSHTWAGNVRELIHIVERLAIRCPDNVIREKDVCLVVPEVTSIFNSRSTKVLVGRYGAQLIAGERKRFEKAINEAYGNREKAAKILGISRPTFFRKAKEFGLVRERIKDIEPPEGPEVTQ
ncbi:sigma-54 dependent transcriptional regulator [Bdellovibrionota bacterium FG-1]